MPRLLVFRRTRRLANSNAATALIAALERSGLTGEIQVAFADRPEVLPRGTEILAYSFMSMDLAVVAAELAALRRAQTRPPVLIAGGPHPSADPRGTLALGFDAAFVGEGERTLPAFVRNHLEGRLRLPRIVEDSGPAWPLDEGLHVEARRGLFPFAEISRGCPHACAFCQVSVLFGRRMRHRSPEKVGQGIALAVAEGFRRFRFLTPDAFAYRGGGDSPAEALPRLLESCRRAGAREQMLGTFPSEVRPDRVTPELVRIVDEQCTNRTLVIGAQSGSDRVLSLMNRGHSVEQAREAVRRVAEGGLNPHVDILLGFPGERPEEARASRDFALWCIANARARIHAHIYIPLPGTAAWPAHPAPPPDDVLESLSRLHQARQLDGDWARQAQQGRQILRWREQGKILV